MWHRQDESSAFGIEIAVPGAGCNLASRCPSLRHVFERGRLTIDKDPVKGLSTETWQDRGKVQAGDSDGASKVGLSTGKKKETLET
jgi:hypothetical protein